MGAARVREERREDASVVPFAGEKQVNVSPTAFSTMIRDLDRVVAIGFSVTRSVFRFASGLERNLVRRW